MPRCDTCRQNVEVVECYMCTAWLCADCRATHDCSDDFEQPSNAISPHADRPNGADCCAVAGFLFLGCEKGLAGVLKLSQRAAKPV